MEKNKKLIIVVAVILLLTVVYFISKSTRKSPVVPQTPPSAEEQKKAERPETKINAITGTVTSIDGKVIKMETPEGNMEFNLPENIKVYAISKTSGLGESNIGNVTIEKKVTVEYNTETKVANYIVVE